MKFLIVRTFHCLFIRCYIAKDNVCTSVYKIKSRIPGITASSLLTSFAVLRIAQENRERVRNTGLSGRSGKVKGKGANVSKCPMKLCQRPKFTWWFQSEDIQPVSTGAARDHTQV